MLAAVRRTIRRRGLLDGGERVLVAISGGPDSSVLLALLDRLAGELDLTLFAASVDHGLRADSELDVACARAAADRLSVPFSALRAQVAEGPSLQAQAREARYQVLIEEAARLACGRVAVGHSLDDQAETVLMRILRGSGVTGLSSIAPERSDGVVRPLIDCSRAQIRAYADHHGLPYREDPSNRDPRFERVRVRTDLMPRLTEEDPRVAEHLVRLADEARLLVGWAREEAGRRLSTCADPRRLPVELVEATPPPARTALFATWIERLTGRPAKRAHLEALDEGWSELALPEGWLVRLEGGAYLARKAPDHPTRSRTSREPPQSGSRNQVLK